MAKFSELVGRTILDISGLTEDGDYVTFAGSDGTKYEMLHTHKIVARLSTSPKS